MSNSSSSSLSQKLKIAIRLVTADSYQAAPHTLDPSFSEFRGCEIKQVPIIRIFGTTAKGEKVCLHVHGVFPYIYIPCIQNNFLDNYTYKLASSLDAAINISLNTANANTQHVYKIQHVTGIPMYGFHKRRHQFFKIYFYNPAMVKRAADLLQNGSVMGQSFQPHEAHIPFILQFMMDFNIYGMSFINLQNAFYRRDTATNEKESPQFMDNVSFQDEKQYMPMSVSKQSTCAIEIDVAGSDVLNRQAIKNGVDTNPGIAAIWEEEKLRRELAGLPTTESQMNCPLTLEREDLPPTSNDVYQKERMMRRLLVISQSSDSETSSDVLSETYPLAVENEGVDLPDASVVEDHLSSSSSNVTLVGDGSVNESSQSILGPEDMSLVDMLSELAHEAESQSTVHEDSILGSQASVFSDNNENPSDNEEEDPDLNFTMIQLDSLSSWDCNSGGPKSCASTNSTLGSLSEVDFRLSCDSDDNKIPAFDGAFDESSSDSDGDRTTKETEFLACALKPYENIVTVTPKKRKLSEGNVEGPSEKRVKRVPKTPTRSPRRLKTLLSPSGRKYSPLNIVISSPKTKENAQQATPKAEDRSNVVRSVFKTKSSNLLQRIEEEEVLAEDSDDSTTNETQRLQDTSPSVARKLNFSQSTSKVHPSFTALTQVLEPRNVCNISESSDEVLSIPQNEDSNLTQSLFSEMLSSRVSDRYVSIVPKYKPPSREDIIDSMKLYKIPTCRYQEPFYGDQSDVSGSKEVAHKLLKVRGRNISDLPKFSSSEYNGIEYWRRCKIHDFNNTGITRNFIPKRSLASHDITKIVPLMKPPTRKRIITWLRAKEIYEKRKTESKEEIEDADKTLCESMRSNDDTLVEEGNHGSSESKVEAQFSEVSVGSMESTIQRALENSKLFPGDKSCKIAGISYGQIEGLSDETRQNVADENFQAKTLAQNQYITIMSLEVHIVTREDLVPDVQKDSIKAAFYAIHNDVPSDSSTSPLHHGVIVVDPNHSHLPRYYENVEYVNNEEDLLSHIVTVVSRFDPEILIGWELETLSWGYVFQRATLLGMNLSTRISRIPSVKFSWEAKSLDLEALAEIKLPGRIVLDIWRIMRHEIALTSYTFENMMYHVMNDRISLFSWKTLSSYWVNESQRHRCKVIDYYLIRVIGVLKMIDQLNIIGRTSEFARLYGVQFYEVFSRGSQFRVESMMLRLAKPQNYIPVSPSPMQRASMRAPEALPLIMEPESCLYNDPVVVLDFQSLYPSIIIAYNYCFSTCLGRVEHIGQSRPFMFGATNLKVTKKLALELEGKVNFSPCGVAFVKKEVRRGVLPQMLTEILNTRLMVKKAMKDHPVDDKTLHRVLHCRQLGLKLIANVTYGYTAANFSGRMPCIEVGDSVVSKGKETLERAIQIVETTPRWGARVVYGDTDSLFILLQGKTRKEAFEIGAEIADTVTNANPAPIKLKFEKILQPAILQTKKRYCGYMYEDVKDEKPVYLAKGIETVRRDGCPAVSKILAKTLKILFDTNDVSLVKKFVTRQFDKILQGRVSLQDLTFAREFRGLRGYKLTACVPSLVLTKRLMLKDPKAIPRNHERVPYIIVAGAPNEPLIRCVKSPMEVLKDSGLRPNAMYYITRVIIPPLSRCLNLIGVDVHAWFNDMPRRQAPLALEKALAVQSEKKFTISQYFGPATCAVCEKQTAANVDICKDCASRPGETAVILNEKLRQMQRVEHLIATICHSCLGENQTISCESLDCPVFYRRTQARKDYSDTSRLFECANLDLF